MDSSRSLEMNVSRKAIQKSYKKFGMRHSINPELSAQIYPLLNKRVNERGIRSLFTRLVFQYIQEQAKKEGIELYDIKEEVFNAHLPLVAETIIAIQYYENQILDQKGGIRNSRNELSKSKIDQNLIAGHIIKDDLYEYIDRHIFPGDLENARLVNERVRKIFRWVDLGQLFQDTYGTLSVWEKGLKKYQSIANEIDQSINYSVINFFWLEINKSDALNKHEWFVRNYLKRIYMTSAALFIEMARLVMDLLGYSEERGAKEYRNILNFAAMQGILGQIVNDNNDFALPKYSLSTISKTPEDAFADLRNDNITLPAMLYLADNPSNIKVLRDMIRRLNKQPSRISIIIDHIGKIIDMPMLSIDTAVTNLHKIIIENISPALEKSIKVSQLIAQKIEEKGFITGGKIGNMLIDMNSIVTIAHNKFYMVMTQSVHRKAETGELVMANAQTDTDIAGIPGTSSENVNARLDKPQPSLRGEQVVKSGVFQSRYSGRPVRRRQVKNSFHFA